MWQQQQSLTRGLNFDEVGIKNTIPISVVSWHQQISEKMPKSHKKPRTFSVHDGCGLWSCTNKSFPLCCLQPWSKPQQVVVTLPVRSRLQSYLPHSHNIPALCMAGAELNQAVVLWALRYSRIPKSCCVWELNLTNLWELAWSFPSTAG